MPDRRTSPSPAALVALATVLTAALSACALIPPQEIPNPLGLDGVQAPLPPIGGPTVPGFERDAACDQHAGTMTHCASVEEAEVPDVDDRGFGGIVSRLDTSVGIEPTVELIGPAGSLVGDPPQAITVAAAVLDLRIEDVASGEVVDPEPFRATPEVPVRFERESTSCSADLCRYAYLAVDPTDPLTVQVAFHGGELDRLLRILVGGGDNRLSGTIAYRVEAEGGAAADSFVVAVTLDSPSGTVHFGF